MTPDEYTELILLRFETNKGAVDLNLRRDIKDAIVQAISDVRQMNIELTQSYSSTWERLNYLEELIFDSILDKPQAMNTLIKESLKIYNEKIKTYRLGLKNEKAH